ncbi:MAG: TrkH family potassium uptake protein [Clostridia bacterium]|nr:TrkH family potassium uptake protein [Clostridia bacterium]
MNRKMVFHMTGQIIAMEGGLLVLPLIVALIYRDQNCIPAFLLTIGIALVLGLGLSFLCKPKDHVIFAKDGFLIVALAWIVVSLIGALPFVLTGEIKSYADAFFETVSGFTTTGASILTDVEKMSHSLQFWRSFTHWIGGMGVLVFIMAIVPSVSGRNIHIMRAEMPGPVVGKLVPRLRDTAKILYLIYLFLTVSEAILLLCGGMNLFESIVHSFGTAGTGGFGVRNSSIGGYSPYIQWVVTIFMLLFGINFNLYYLLLIRRFRPVFKSEELWTYLCAFLIASAIICINILPLYQNVAECIRTSSFQVASIITTTGFVTTNINEWPTLSKTILLLLMLMGACGGSTAGGLKVSRVMLLFKMIRREIKHMLHPRSVSAVNFEGKPVEVKTLISVCVYFALYAGILAFVFLILSFDPKVSANYDIETNLSAAVSCFNNIGPGLGTGFRNVAESFAGYSIFSKVVLSLAMLLGRLELYPLVIAMSPSTWRKQ